MDWNKQMSRELKKTGLDFKLQKVSKERSSTSKEVEELNQKLDSKLMENKSMRERSFYGFTTFRGLRLY